MKLLAQLRLGAFVLLLLVLGASAYVFVGYVETYRQCTRDLQAMVNYGLVLKVGNALSAERGPSNRLLSREKLVSTDPAYTALGDARARTDLAFDRFERAQRNNASSNQAIMDAVRQARTLLMQGRQRVDDLLGKSLADRTAEDLQAAIDQMIEARIELDAPIEYFSWQAASEASSLVGPIVMARIINDLREYGGRMGSMLMVPLLTQEPISPARKSAIEDLHGRIEQLHRLMARDVGSSRDITLARARVEQGYFGQAMPLMDGLVARSGSDYGLSASSFTDQVIPELHSIEVLGDLFVQQAVGQVTETRRHAREQMILLGVILIGFLCLLVVALRAADKWIVRPLFHASQEIIDLAQGRPGLQRHSQGHSAEIISLYDAIDVLREHHHQSERVAAERDELSKELHRMAYTDALTGLHNRRALDDMAGDLTVSSAPLMEQRGLILIDVDYFKSINDTYGHVVGDVVLREVAARIKEVAAGRHQVFRYGGEEFAVLSTDMSVDELCAVAEDIRHALARGTISAIPDIELLVTASFGVAVRSDSIATWFDLLREADLALYRAKAMGRNQLVPATERA